MTENVYIEDLEILKTKKLVSLDPCAKRICLLDETKNNNLNYNTIQRRKESIRKRKYIIRL